MGMDEGGGVGHPRECCLRERGLSRIRALGVRLLLPGGQPVLSAGRPKSFPNPGVGGLAAWRAVLLPPPRRSRKLFLVLPWSRVLLLVRRSALARELQKI